MKTGQQVVTIARRLYEARDAARRIAGDQYLAKVRRWTDIITNAMESWGCGALDVAPRLIHETKAAGGSISAGEMLWLFAATVEVIEPTEGSAD